jgi:hypothetical protein
MDAADRLLEKIRRFVATELDDEERELFATLLAPGVALAHEPQDEVSGFAMTDWRPTALPESLGETLRRGGVRVEGLG